MGREVAPDLSTGVCQAAVEQETGRFDGTRAKEDCAAALPQLFPLVPIEDCGNQAATIALESVYRTLGSNLRSCLKRSRKISHIHARLRSIAATLVAIAAIHTRVTSAIFGLAVVAA